MSDRSPLSFLSLSGKLSRETLPVNSELFVPGDNLRADPGNLAACINAAARQARSELLVVCSADLAVLSPEFPTLLDESVHANPDGALFYGIYSVGSASGKDETVRVWDDIGDITEREDWGPVWAIRIASLLASGGLDERYPRAAFYDLLLKMQEVGRRVRIPQTLATVSAQPEGAQSAVKAKLFFPGRGKLGGFSYLFMDPEEERQTESIFYSALKRRASWLEGERTARPPKAADTSPIVSIITPIYNRASFIGDAVASVQRNALKDWEHIIVDNGSTDGTRDVVRRLAARDKRIRLVENDRNIIALSLNIALRHARGKYIAQLDSDDEYTPQTLQSMVSALEANPTWALAISYYALMDETGHSLPDLGVIKHLEYNRNNILRVDGAGAVRCWHRSVIQEMGGFDEKDFADYGEDYDLVLKVSEKYEIGRVHEVCYRYRRHPDNTDARRDPLMKLRNKTLARQRALERRRLQNQSVPTV